MTDTVEFFEPGKQDSARGQRLLSKIGPAAVILALTCALASFFILSGLTAIQPTGDIVVALFLADVIAILILVAIVLAEGWTLLAAWREGKAAARLHLRIVKLFSIIAAVPAIVMAVAGAITLDRAINPAFMNDIRGFIFNTATAAQFFRQSQCHSLLREADLSASDLDRAKPMYDADKALFHDFLSSRAKFLGFTSAALMREDGTILDEVSHTAEGQPKTSVMKPEPGDYADARRHEPTCLVLDDGQAFAALRELPAYGGAFLYVARPTDPFTQQFPQQAASLITIYNGFEEHRRNILLAFAIMFGLLALIMLLSAVWLGLSFANRLVAPIRRLIAATDQVAAGNLYVRVPPDRTEGDLSHLGETFNNMTTELRLQQNRLLAANRLNDERRAFSEAVLSGVPAAVVGIDPKGDVSVLNPSAEQLVVTDTPPIGQAVGHVLPEIGPILQDAAGHGRPVEKQIALMRQGKERTVNVRVTTAQTAAGRSYVATLDDITDLVTAQRTSAWADVARRIAHEIKNPLTPIQLSAERLKRKYGRVITQDRDIFDQCTDTIVRQVDDIKRMVDEFSSFARMPKARPETDDLAQCVREIVFLMRVGHPETTIEERIPEEQTVLTFDRRLISQALTNVIKNAIEGIGALDDPAHKGVVEVTLHIEGGEKAIIDIIDNGKGFPIEGRQRLLEPYVTTRSEGTGLGLPIVAKIIEEHGGRLELLDAPEHRGACVRIILPIRVAAADEAPAPEPISQAD